MLSGACLACRSLLSKHPIARDNRVFRRGIATLKTVEELIDYAQIAASSIGIAELEREPEAAGVRVLQVENGE